MGDTQILTSDIKSAYNKYNHTQWLRFSSITAIVAGSLIPIFSILDYYYYPNYFYLFLALRLTCTIAIGALWALTATIAQAHVKPIAIFGAILVQSMICYMVFVTEGPDSNYYAGLNLTIIAMGLILPTMLHETILYVLATLLVYIVVCILHGGFRYTGELFGNVFFLLSTGVVASISTYYLRERRYKEFILSYQLEQRNSELAELYRQKNHFFANISHELRTPLTLILAPVQELLSSGKKLPEAIECRLNVVRNNAFRLLKLVNDLLDIIRLEETNDRLNMKPVELNGFLSAMIDGMTYLADSKHIKLHKELFSQAIVIPADIRALEKIVINLLNNALKFTDKGGHITLLTHIDDTHAWIEVQDTGIGISQDELPHIFNRFHQVDGSSTRHYQGTGLGLALVKEMCESMGGGIAADSVQGAGTCIRLHLPLGIASPHAGSDQSAVSHDPIENLHHIAESVGGMSVRPLEEALPIAHDGVRRTRLLVVEDEPDMRRYLVDILCDEYQVLQACTGRDGLDITLHQHPELILLDLMLPELDGLEVCRRIRAHELSPQPKIMLLTARVDEQAKLTALEYGADDFLTKPFSSIEVKTRLHNLHNTIRLESDLLERNTRLEHTLDELKTTQTQLIHSEKLNALGSLSAGLLHEINNPLNYSLTALHLIRSDPDVLASELLREVVADIDEGMQRIRTIVCDLQTFAHPSESDKQQAFDFSQAVDSALRFVSSEIKGIDVHLDLPPGESACVLGSQSHIVQVLVNLLSNAAKAVSPIERAGEILIRARIVNKRLEAEVTDNGIGISDDNMQKIFDPFFTTRDVGKGMGLGLSICHTIIANHGGGLRVKSRHDAGTQMCFDLPLCSGVVV